jgi:eukaryotic-like serine/threonine-protein kinase
MTPERWQQVRQVFDVALTLHVAERSRYLDKICASDSELRGEVESLLLSNKQAGSGFLNTPAVDLRKPTASAATASSRVGRRIGAYDIFEEIGHGGMGEVYRAARADGQFTKEVAVKLVRGGLDTSFVLERFRHERQILAGLDHPNIARLLDGGTTEDGIPYLVMELVNGKPIDRYCDAHCLSISQRLELFRQVCAAVQYAHQRLVIHRDIKPSNVLVTEEGMPKLLDFGIAKILDPSAGAETTLARPMTPEYASPEQVRGESITTATDVYSLGVVLYQLLTGHSPYPVDTRSAHELARAICDAEPTRPSAVVLRGGTAGAGDEAQAPTPELVSSVREGTQAKLRRRLAGDLDNIVLMALRKEPSLRYASVEQFTEDIRNHLEGRPVSATKGSWKYRAAKFAARHRVGVAATAVVVLALAVGIGATVREARIARHQAEIASAERARAEQRFNDVRQLSDSLIFDIHDAIQNLPGATPARKLLLDRAVQYLDRVAKDSGGDPDLQRELAWGYQRLAVVQGSTAESNLGDAGAAEASDRKALALFESVAKANPHDVIDQLNVAMIHRILAFSSLMESGGKRDLEQAMGITEQLIKKDPTNPKVRSERSIEYQNLAFMQDALGDRAHALESYRQNQALKQDLFRTNPEYRKIRRSLGMSSVLLGSALARSGLRQDALKTVRQGIEFYDTVPKGEDEVNVRRERAISQQKLGDILLMNGDARAALASYQQARSALQPMAKADPQNTMLQLDIAAMDYHEGRALATLHRYNDAITNLQRAASAFEALHAPTRSADDSPHGLGAIYIWLGEAHAGKGDLQAALQNYRKATVALGETPTQKTDDDTRCEIAVSYIKTANILARMESLSEASAAYRKALEITVPAAAPEHHDVPALYAIADAYAELGDVTAAMARREKDTHDRARLEEEARAVYRNSLNAWEQIPSPSRINPGGFMVSSPVRVADQEKMAAALASAAGYGRH